MTAHPRPPYDEDDDLDLRALYRTLPRAEPSPALDAAVRESAARAAAADRKGRRQRQVWHPGWGVAASIVLTACLFLVTDFEQSEQAVLSDAPPASVGTSAADTPPAVASARLEKPASAQRQATTPQAERALPPPMAAAPASIPRRAAEAPRAHHDQTARSAADGETPGSVDQRIAEIRAWLKQGNRDAAIHALRQLRLDTPHLTLPPDLQSLLLSPAVRP